MNDSFHLLSSRTGHLCGGLSLLCVLCGLGFVSPGYVRDNHGVLHGSLQPDQLLVFSQVGVHVSAITQSLPFGEIFTNNTLTLVTSHSVSKARSA